MLFATIVPQDAAEIKRSVRELAKAWIRPLTGVSPASTVTALRTQLDATPPGVAGPDYQACTRLVASLQERCPNLKVQDSLLDLQEDLADTEQRIALGWGYFNDAVTHYNTRSERVPDRFRRGLARLKPQPLMAANDFERAPVPADLAQ